MDFNSLGAGQPFYVLQKSEKPVLQVGVVKTKSEPKSPYNTQTPGILNGLSAMQGQNLVVDVVITVGNNDIPFNNLPTNAESTTYNNGNTVVSCSREAMLQAVDGMLQASRKALEQVDYHKSVLSEGEKMLETLNPRYKEEKDRDRSIRSLEERQDKQDKKLDELRRQSRSQYEGILEALDKHADEMRKESDARFASMMETMDRRFEEQEGRFGMIIENKVTARLDAFLEYLPGAYKSYDRLEKRVDKIEMRQQILERTVSDHLQKV